MANNRMLLIHRPTGLAIVLAKRMMDGWYRPPSQDAMGAFFDEVDTRTVPGDEVSMDDYCLGMESCDADSPFVKTDIYLFFSDRRQPDLLHVNGVESEVEPSRRVQLAELKVNLRKLPQRRSQLAEAVDLLTAKIGEAERLAGIVNVCLPPSTTPVDKLHWLESRLVRLNRITEANIKNRRN